MRREELRIITEAIEGLIPAAAPAHLIVTVAERLPGSVALRNTWHGTPGDVGRTVFTALYGRPDTTPPASPLAQAQDAKGRRDLGGEIGALMAADQELTSAPWYPARPGDLVHVAYEQAGAMPAFGETYVIGPASAHGLMSMILLAHTLPDSTPEDDVKAMTGCFEAEVSDDPLYGVWFEAGPHRLTIVRDGQVVHDGAVRRVGGVAAAGLMLRTFAQAVTEAEGYLERGEPELALARLRSPGPLPPCGAPGIMPDHEPCARPRGHGGPHCDDPDYREAPHECPALPEQLHAVVTVDADCADVHFAGLYEEREVAVDVAAGHEAYVEEHTAQSVRDYAHGTVAVVLPGPRQFRRTGVQMAVVVPLRVLPDPRAEDEWAAEGMAASMEPDPDYGKDLDDE